MFSEASSTTDDADTFGRNMAAFKKWFPHVHERLAAIAAPHSSLVVRPDGGIDMVLQGTYFYEEDAVSYTERQLDNFLKTPVRRFFDAPDPEMLRGITGEYCRRLRGDLDRRGMSVGDVTDPTSYFAIVFGLGLGLHVEPLLDSTDCRMLILVEPNIENLFHSMSVIEWSTMFQRLQEQGREIAFVLEDDVDAILLQIRNAIRDRNPALVDGMYIYSHYHSSVLARAREGFNSDLVLLVVGLGYLEDEYKMTANVASNIARQSVRVLADPLPQRSEPLLIVGSGPSIDRDLDVLTAFADKVAIMTVGTGLRVLLNRGIRPDFHVEVENGLENADYIEVVRDEFGLEGILLVGAVTLHPAVRELFDDSILFFRERSSATMLFAEGRGVIQPSGPTVANAALSSAVRMGFREIYLFGLDMGTKIGGRYHSVHSVYGAGHFEEPVTETDKRMPGNFGGEATAESVLFWSRYMLEGFLRLHPQIDVFNCSDGARIAGATPKVSRVLRFEGPSVDRAALFQSIVKDIPTIGDTWLGRCWDREAQIAEALELAQGLRSIVMRAKQQQDPGRCWMDEIVKAVRYEVGESPVVRSYFFGTFVLMLGVFWWYDRRLSSTAEQSRGRQVALELFELAIDYAERVVLLLLNNVDRVLSREMDIIPISNYDDPSVGGMPCRLG